MLDAKTYIQRYRQACDQEAGSTRSHATASAGRDESRVPMGWFTTLDMTRRQLSRCKVVPVLQREQPTEARAHD